MVERVVLVALVIGVVALLVWRDILRPGSFRRRETRDVDRHGALMWGYAALSTYLVALFGAALVAASPLAGDVQGTLRQTGVAQLGLVVCGLLASFFMLRLMGGGDDAKASGLRMRFGDVPLGLLAFLLAAPVIVLTMHLGDWLYERFRDGPGGEFAHDLLYDIVESRGTPWAWPIRLGPILGAAVLEEVVFRGFAQSAVLRLTRSPWTAIVVTSVLFALLHIGAIGARWDALLTLFVLSMALGIAFERTRRLGVPIVMHGAFNAANIWWATQQGLG